MQGILPHSKTHSIHPKNLSSKRKKLYRKFYTVYKHYPISGNLHPPKDPSQ